MALTETYATTEAYFSDTSVLRSVMGTTSTADDANQQLILRSASRWAEGYIGYPIGVRSLRETLPSYSTRRLMLLRTPLRAVRLLLDAPSTVDGQQMLSSEFDVEREEGFVSRDVGFEWSAPVDYDLGPIPRAGQEVRQWLADYVAGWTYLGVDTGSVNWSTEAGTTSTGRTLPEDIERAILLKGAAIALGTEQVQSESLGDVKVEYRRPYRGQAAEMPWETLLAPYQRNV